MRRREVIMARSTEGTVVCFVEAAQKNRAKYRNFTLRFVHNRDAAEELVNDGFMHLWEKRNEITDANIEGYFYTILKNLCLNWLRNERTHYELRNTIYDSSYRLLKYDIATLESFDPNLIFTREIHNIMHRQLNRMPELSRRIFLDNRFGDLSYEEIAAKYGISYSKVDREIRTSLKNLRLALKDYLPPVFAVMLFLASLINFCVRSL